MPEPMGFFTDTTVCIGCKACEVACKEWNQLPAENGGGGALSGDSYDNTPPPHGIHRRPGRLLERSGEDTSELQSPFDLVCRLLLVKKNKSPGHIVQQPMS